MRRPSWGLLTALVLLVALPIFEVWLLIRVGQQIGLLPTIIILVVEAALGGWLMRREGARAWSALNTAFQSGRMPSGELADAALILVGGVLLMLPGFATDVIGFLFLLPITRPYARRVLGFLVARRVNRLRVNLANAGHTPGDLIEGEVADPSTDSGHDSSGPDMPIVISGEIEDKLPKRG
jgi:UPF0716 protein FxsA